MDSFKKELDALLTKYPDLPEFSLTVRPRVVVELKVSNQIVYPSPVYTVPTAPNNKSSDPVVALESKINAQKIKDMESSITTL